MSRIISYSVECPPCKTQGVTRMLGLDPEHGICCDAETPHIFSELPGSPASPECHNLAQQQPGQAEAQQADAVRGESQPRQLSAIMQERAQRDAQPADSPQLSAAEENEKIAREYGLEIDKLAPVPEGKDQLAASIAQVTVGETVPLPGGDLLIGLRISEQWVGVIQGYADSQGQTFAKYMEEFINSVALLNEWSNAPSLPAEK